jgi:hypothetical protein
MGLHIDSLPVDPAQFKAYMSALDDKSVDRLKEALETRFNEVHAKIEAGEELREIPDGIGFLTGLRDKIQSAKAEIKDRKHAALDAEAKDAAERQKQVLAKLKASVGSDDAPPPAEGSVATLEVTEDGFQEAFAGKLLQAVDAATTAALSNIKGIDLNQHIRNMPLSAAAAHAPDPKVAPRRSEPTLVATADIPGVTQNSRIPTYEGLIQTMHARARMLQTTRLGQKANFVPVATLERDFRYRLALDSTPEEVNEVLKAATDVQTLVAAGGWCSPSEISYDFYNIVAEDGLIDLPSVGVLNRGGLRYPTSPAIGDILGSLALWSWTEEQDEAAVDSDSELKTCARVDCPTFEEVRTACDGLCVTVGNLVDFAYPELVQNHIRLIFAARAHLTNQSILAGLATSSTAVNLTGLGVPGAGAAASILAATELQVEDYRARFRMAMGSILEAVFPHWALGLFRADLANRNGVDLLSVSNGQIADWLNERGVRAQFVYDWQSGFDTDPFGDPDTIATTWPSTIDFLLYAPGTFVRGQGLQLDLGVVRDSVLNERNDHTAAWMEDCYAIAMVGHESRLVTADVCVAGTTGAAELTCGS